MNGFMNNPIIDMFKNPMEMWSKGFDQQNWIDLSGKMMGWNARQNSFFIIEFFFMYMLKRIL